MFPFLLSIVLRADLIQQGEDFLQRFRRPLRSLLVGENDDMYVEVLGPRAVLVVEEEDFLACLQNRAVFDAW